MKIKDILKIEQNNKTSIFLIKEGFFWRAYERSAYHFVQNIKKFQITKIYVKKVKQEIIFLGFPDSILEQILKIVETIHVSSLHVIKKETIIEIQGFADTQGFEQWKEGIKLKVNPVRDVACNVSTSHPCIFALSNFNHIIEKIREYPIINKTPVQAFNFLAELKNEING
jgi:hypothetical protein